MKKYSLLNSIAFMIAVVGLSFAWMMYTDSRSYQDLVEEHVESIVKMTSLNIKKEMESTLNEQITVASSMAINTMLQNWLESESDHQKDDAYMKQLYDYLHTYQSEYGYTTVFCVSDQTGNYYYQDGFNKTIHKNDEHDVWYYNFLNSNQDYDVQVDTDQSNGGVPTIFVNYRVKDANGKLLGVVGVAVELSDIQQVVTLYEKNYDLSIYLINRGGKNSFSQKVDHFVSPAEIENKLGISQFIAVTDAQNGIMEWKNTDSGRTCIIDTYAEALKWNIIAVKNTDSLKSVFLKRLRNNVVAVIAIMIGCISIITFVFHQFNQQVIQYENTDELTGLANRKIFEQHFEKSTKGKQRIEKCLFMLDIDNFKAFNDTKGHIYGNMVLSMVGDNLRKLVKDNGIASRWGGDEFIGIINGNLDETEVIMNKLRKSLITKDVIVTLSIGIMELEHGVALVDDMNLVDKALYQAKKSGKDKVVRVVK